MRSKKNLNADIAGLSIPPELRQYHVGDLLVDPGNPRLALLMESPHTAEVAHQHPLAGRSGQAVTRFFIRHVPAFRNWEPGEPIGCQLIRREYPFIGILNSFNFPLDRSAYAAADYKSHAGLIDAWDFIRRNPLPRNRRDQQVRQVENQILVNLEKRIASLPKDCLVVPCGAVARSLLNKCGDRKQFIYPLVVPHPSRNNWSRAEYFGDQKHFISTLQQQMAAET